MNEGKRVEKKAEGKVKKNKINNKQKKIIKRIFITIFSIIIIAIIAMIANDFIILDNNKTTNLVINNRNVTSSLKQQIIIENNIIYLSQPDISNFFDNYIYYEKEIDKIITTYDKKVVDIGFENNELTINGSTKEIYGHAIKRDDIIYLPISEMKDVYNIEIENIEKTKVITIDSIDREQKKAIVTSDLAVKSSTNFIAKTIDRVKKGDYVVVISSEKDNTKIRTPNGKIGYIKTKKLANEIKVRENMDEEKQITGKENLTWDYYSTVGSAPNREGTTIEGINVVSPAFFYLDKNGELQENIGTNGEKYIQWAHNNGYKVWPMFSNAEAANKSLSITSDIVNSYEKRQKLIEELIDKCVKYKIDGINVDFENMKQEDKDMYSRFIIELTPRLKEIGLVTSVDVTAPDGGETWSMCFDRHVIGDVADYIIFMAYDEYGISSTKPGTTAGYDWVKLSLNKFLTTEEIKPDKIILGIPFYTRIWTTDQYGKSTSKTVNMKNIENVIPNGIEKQWKDELKQNYVEYTEGINKKQIWIEDMQSLKEKISLIKENNLAGVASWQKDMEKEEVWSMLKQELGN